jgi:hypothetical protein
MLVLLEVCGLHRIESEFDPALRQMGPCMPRIGFVSVASLTQAGFLRIFPDLGFKGQIH